MNTTTYGTVIPLFSYEKFVDFVKLSVHLSSKIKSYHKFRTNSRKVNNSFNHTLTKHLSKIRAKAWLLRNIFTTLFNIRNALIPNCSKLHRVT